MPLCIGLALMNDRLFKSIQEMHLILGRNKSNSLCLLLEIVFSTNFVWHTVHSVVKIPQMDLNWNLEWT